MKVGITLDDELLKRIDTYADANYMSRSGFLSVAATQYLNAVEVETAIKEMSLAMRKIADTGKIDHEVMEQLEDFEFEPMIESCKPKLKDKSIPLYCSNGRGGGEWMRQWEDDCRSIGANLIFESIICNDAPDDEALSKCEELAKTL